MCVCVSVFVSYLSDEKSFPLFLSFFVFFLSRLFRVSEREKKGVFVGQWILPENSFVLFDDDDIE